MTTNITADHRAAFEALTSGDYANFALFSCFVMANRQAPSSPSTGTATSMRSRRCSSASRRR
jgi:hypothetical protein